MKTLYKLICAGLFTTGSLLYSQSQQITVAQIGNEKISVKDFQFRYELSPYIPNDKSIDPDSLKYDFLYSLIAEKLWAMDADKSGFTRTKEFDFLMQPIRDIFVRDALFTIEVKDKVLLSSNDLSIGIIKAQTKLNTQIFSGKDSSTIYKFYKEAQIVSSIDSLLTSYSNITRSEGDITLGKLKDEEIEDSLYSLSIGQLTTPVNSEVGWIIFRITNKSFTPVDLTDNKKIEDIKSTIRNRRIEKRYYEYLSELLTGITINIEQEPFDLIYKKLWDILSLNNSNNNNTKSYFELTEYDFNSLVNNTGNNNISRMLFSIGEKEFKIFHFLSSLSFNGFSVAVLDSNVVKNKLNYLVKKFIEDQLITIEGYKRNLHLTPSVQNELTKWQENYLAQMYFLSTRDSIKISESEVYNYYLNEIINVSNIHLINIRMVMLNDLNEVGIILDKLKNGSSFGDLIKKYGQTDPVVNESGETGLKPTMLLGDLAVISSDLKLNEVYGPIKRQNGYCVLQVIERQQTNDSLKLSFENAKEQLKNTLRDRHLVEKLNTRTMALAEKYNVKIYPDAVDKIQTTQIPVFVHRLMGFGGRIAGVPLLTPFSSWFEGDIKRKVLP